MTGSLVAKHGKYYVVVRVPDGKGDMKTKWINTGIPTDGHNKRKAQQAMIEILSNLEEMQDLAPGDMLFSKAIEKWMKIKATEVRQNTMEGYRIYVDKHIAPYFDAHNLTLKEITAQNIQDFYGYLLKNDHSPNSIKKYHVIIRGTLKEAVLKKQIRSNPANDVTLPKQVKFTGKAYSAEQAKRLLKAIEDEELKPAVILGLYYGLRRSEVCGLRWQDIDFDAGVMHIQNTVVKMTTTIEAEQTKSAASKRTMILIPDTVPYLKELHEKYLANPVDPVGHVCVHKTGKPFSPDYVTQGFANLLKRHNLPHIRFHELRHTCGSGLLESGMNMKQIQEYLGHENVSTTLDIYAHLSAEGKKESANAIEQFFKFA